MQAHIQQNQSKAISSNVKSSTINITVVFENANLNKTNWNQEFLDRVNRQNQLKHGEAVLYINRSRDRFRLVVCFYGTAVLIIPPVDKADRISLYLKISQFLRNFTKKDLEIDKVLKTEIDHTTTRIERRKKLAEEAQKRRKANKR